MEGTVAEIRLFAGNFAPRNWALCQGQLMSIAQNTALFALIGTFYGGNGQTTFALPDLRGRVPVGVGQGPGLSLKDQGQIGGVESVTLLTSQMPAHNHNVNVNAGAGTSGVPTNNYIAGAVDATANAIPSFAAAPTANTLNPNSLSPVGQSQPHENMPPFLVLNYIICLFGIFPSRN